MNLTPEVELRIRAAILAGASEEEIAGALGVSVKVVRPIRRAVETERMPR